MNRNKNYGVCIKDYTSRGALRSALHEYFEQGKEVDDILKRYSLGPEVLQKGIEDITRTVDKKEDNHLRKIQNELKAERDKFDNIMGALAVSDPTLASKSYVAKLQNDAIENFHNMSVIGKKLTDMFNKELDYMENNKPDIKDIAVAINAFKVLHDTLIPKSKTEININNNNLNMQGGASELNNPSQVLKVHIEAPTEKELEKEFIEAEVID